jgi:hypothetical protein
MPEISGEPALRKIRSLCQELAARHGLDDAARDELCDHLESKLAGYLDGSVKITEDDALLLVRGHFGDADKIARRLARERGSLIVYLFYRLLGALTVASLLLCGGVLGISAIGGWSDNGRAFHPLPLRFGYIAKDYLDGEGRRGMDIVVVHWRRYPIVGPSWGPKGESSPAVDEFLRQHPWHFFDLGQGFLLDFGAEQGGSMGRPAVIAGSRLDMCAPYWALAVLLSILPIGALLRWLMLWLRRNHRRNQPDSPALA